MAVLQAGAVLFDAGLTLIRTESTATDVALEALEKLGVRAREPELSEAMDTAEERIRSVWMQDVWWASDRMVRELFVGSYEIGLRSLAAVGDDVALASRLANEIYDTYHEARHWGLYPDVLPTLTALRDSGVAMGIVSDWGHGLEAIVLELELGDLVSFVVVSARLGVAKPDPEVFRLALARIGVAPPAAMYVGDTYMKDVLGARAAGLTPVLLDRLGSAPAVDCHRVTSLTELLPLMGIPAPSEATRRQQ